MRNKLDQRRFEILEWRHSKYGELNELQFSEPGLYHNFEKPDL